MPRPREAELEANGAAGYSSVPAWATPEAAIRHRYTRPESTSEGETA